MCKNLVEKGPLDTLILYNRTKSRAEALSSALGSSKTKVASTISEAVTPAEIICKNTLEHTRPRCIETRIVFIEWLGKVLR